MKHKIKDKKALGFNKWVIAIELIPESADEKQEIKLIENMQANHEQRERINNYVLFCLENYSVYNLIQQKGNVFVVEALYGV